jgi:hypothetical protein
MMAGAVSDSLTFQAVLLLELLATDDVTSTFLPAHELLINTAAAALV